MFSLFSYLGSSPVGNIPRGSSYILWHPAPKCSQYHQAIGWTVKKICQHQPHGLLKGYYSDFLFADSNSPLPFTLEQIGVRGLSILSDILIQIGQRFSISLRQLWWQLQVVVPVVSLSQTKLIAISRVCWLIEVKLFASIVILLK